MQTIDATGVSFGGQTGATASLPQNFAIEDKITHAVDDSSLGFVRVKAGNVFVTPNSFNSPTTTTADIQRGINVASSGDTVNVEAGTYSDNVIVNKPLTLLGSPNAGVAGSNTRSAESEVLTNGNQVAVFTISSNGVKIDGFDIEGDDPNVTGVTLTSGNDANAEYGIRPSAGYSNLTIQDNIIRNVEIGFRGDGCCQQQSDHAKLVR